MAGAIEQTCMGLEDGGYEELLAFLDGLEERLIFLLWTE
jgi:hypothetical protein